MGGDERQERAYRVSSRLWKPGTLIPHRGGIAQGPLIPPRNLLNMGNSVDSEMAQQQSAASRDSHPQQQQQARNNVQMRSNLTVLMEERERQQEEQRRAAALPQQQQQQQASRRPGNASARTVHENRHAVHGETFGQHLHSEADLASGPVPAPPTTAVSRQDGSSRRGGNHSAPSTMHGDIRNDGENPPPSLLPPSTDSSVSAGRSMDLATARRSTGAFKFLPSCGTQGKTGEKAASSGVNPDRPVRRRCMSSKELGMLAPPTGSPYAYMLYQREILEATMQQRLLALRQSDSFPDRSMSPSPVPGGYGSEESDSVSRNIARLKNASRNRRRAEHTQAVIADLCEIVTDLFVAESKLLNPSKYGVDSSVHRDEVLQSVLHFVSALPPRYALSVDSPSEVLLHMRLMAAARSDSARAAVHILSLEGKHSFESTLPRRPNRSLRLVTVSCTDASGLLEYMTKLLSTGGSRVLDADVMTSTDGIVLDRYVVEMNGRLRLNKLANYIEGFLAQSREKEEADEERSTGAPLQDSASPEKSPGSVASDESDVQGPVYFHPPNQTAEASPREIQEEIQSAVPLTEVLRSDSVLAVENTAPSRSQHRRQSNSSIAPLAPVLRSPEQSHSSKSSGSSRQILQAAQELSNSGRENLTPLNLSMRQRRPLVNREATAFNDDIEQHRDFLLVPPPPTLDHPPFALAGIEDRVVPLIPFDELMLIETLGTGRVSTIYRAAWKQNGTAPQPDMPGNVCMVALKVATVNPETGDTAHVDELRREADIAAMLKHNNVCDLVGVAADAECFCLAYEFCEGGSLLALLSDTSRYYEYLPIALDIANGMAYLHSRNVIHRDLKPSNVLLTRDRRAKISDFGMSVANTGQELTAETGTYRYMAPEVIRHESYSSNADVYSFGIVLWQLITREVPFATMTPIQAAFAVASGRRPDISPSTPARLQELITACWDQDSHKRPSFTYIAMALADYARMAFSPANVGAQTLQIANEMLANVDGNSNINVDFSTPVGVGGGRSSSADFSRSWFLRTRSESESYSSNVGLEI